MRSELCSTKILFQWLSQQSNESNMSYLSRGCLIEISKKDSGPSVENIRRSIYSPDHQLWVLQTHQTDFRDRGRYRLKITYHYCLQAILRREADNRLLIRPSYRTRTGEDYLSFRNASSSDTYIGRADVDIFPPGRDDQCSIWGPVR